MSNNIVKLHIPDGGSAHGTKVELEDGSKLGGIQSIKLEASVADPVWKMTLDVKPNFLHQVPADVELYAVNIGNIDDLTDEQLKAIGLQRIDRGTS